MTLYLGISGDGDVPCFTLVWGTFMLTFGVCNFWSGAKSFTVFVSIESGFAILVAARFFIALAFSVLIC
jgi:hypothetical protein